MRIDEANSLRMPEELRAFSYRAAYRTALILFGTWVIAIAAATVGFAVAALLDTGSYLFGSGMLNAIRAHERAMDFVMSEFRPFMAISVLATGGLMMTLEKGPITQLLAALACVAVHILAIGAML